MISRILIFIITSQNEANQAEQDACRLGNSLSLGMSLRYSSPPIPARLGTGGENMFDMAYWCEWLPLDVVGCDPHTFCCCTALWGLLVFVSCSAVLSSSACCWSGKTQARFRTSSGTIVYNCLHCLSLSKDDSVCQHSQNCNGTQTLPEARPAHTCETEVDRSGLLDLKVAICLQGF